MKKQISVLLMLSISITALSQTNTLEEISQEVNQLVSIHGDKLNNDDQLLLRKNLRQIINVFKVNGYGIPTGGSFICDSNNNQLINLDNGKLIYDFTTFENCQEALRNVKNGKSFCDLMTPPPCTVVSACGGGSGRTTPFPGGGRSDSSS